MSDYRLTASAAIDIDELVTYLEEQAAPAAALRMDDELFAKFDLLAEYPGLGHRRAELTPLPLVFFTAEP